jgi:hypothetical protein
MVSVSGLWDQNETEEKRRYRLCVSIAATTTVGGLFPWLRSGGALLRNAGKNAEEEDQRTEQA